MNADNPWIDIGNTIVSKSSLTSKKGKLDKPPTPPTPPPIVKQDNKDQAWYERQYLEWEVMRRNEKYRTNMTLLGINVDELANPHAEMAGLPDNPEKWIQKQKELHG